MSVSEQQYIMCLSRFIIIGESKLTNVYETMVYISFIYNLFIYYALLVKTQNKAHKE
jgi:hypothetical protein